MAVKIEDIWHMNSLCIIVFVVYISFREKCVGGLNKKTLELYIIKKKINQILIRNSFLFLFFIHISLAL